MGACMNKLHLNAKKNINKSSGYSKDPFVNKKAEG